jgi:hypothetical protein
MSTNEYGLDTSYIGKNLKILQRDIKSYKPDEMSRALMRLAETCKTENTCPKCQGHNTMMFSADDNYCNDCKESYCVC